MNKALSHSSGLGSFSLITSWISSRLGFPTNRYQENRSRAFSERLFCRILTAEIARSTKSESPTVLVTLDVQRLQGADGCVHPLVEDLLFSILSGTLRETDVVGWQRQNETMGVILTELGRSSIESVTEVISAKLEKAIQRAAPAPIPEKVSVDVNVIEVPANGKSAPGSSAAPRNDAAVTHLAPAVNS